MTYRLPALHDQIHVMIPDLVIYVELHGSKYELFVLEAKKPWNYNNGNIENDLLKLGKELQVALNKLIVFGVHNPVVPGLHIEGKWTSLCQLQAIKTIK